MFASKQRFSLSKIQWKLWSALFTRRFVLASFKFGTSSTMLNGNFLVRQLTTAGCANWSFKKFAHYHDPAVPWCTWNSRFFPTCKHIKYQHIWGMRNLRNDLRQPFRANEWHLLKTVTEGCYQNGPFAKKRPATIAYYAMHNQQNSRSSFNLQLSSRKCVFRKELLEFCCCKNRFPFFGEEALPELLTAG